MGGNIKIGDTIKVQRYTMGKPNGFANFKIEEFRHCLGFFESENCRKAGEFTPLCHLYIPGPNSKEEYIPNFGPYNTNMIPGWEKVN